MKVAIIGAGLSGLSAGIALEQRGIIPDIFEQKAMVGLGSTYMKVVFSPPVRSITPNPLRYLENLLNIKLIPSYLIEKLVLHSKNSQATIKEKIGFTFKSGVEPDSLENQLLKHLKKTAVRYEKHIELEAIRNKYDHIIVATGPDAHTLISDRYLKNWECFNITFTRLLDVSGVFTTGQMDIWVNKSLLKNGFGFQIPFNQTRASIILTVPNLNGWDEFDLIWENFLNEYKILVKNQLLQSSQKIHVTSKAKTSVWENCFFVGDCGGFLDPFLGIGSKSAMATGAFVGKAIAENKDYDKTVKYFRDIIDNLDLYRIAFMKMDDELIDTIVNIQDNTLLKKLIFGTEIDWVNYGATLLKPLTMLEVPKPPDFHKFSETHTKQS